MSIRFAPEAEGLGASYPIAPAVGVTDALGEVVPAFEPTRYELQVLAEHYMDRIWEIDWRWELSQQASSSDNRFEPFAYGRLGRIREILGERDFENATNSTNQKWEKGLAQLKEIPRCMACGARMVGPDGVCRVCGTKDDPVTLRRRSGSLTEAAME